MQWVFHKGQCLQIQVSGAFPIIFSENEDWIVTPILFFLANRNIYTDHGSKIGSKEPENRQKLNSESVSYIMVVIIDHLRRADELFLKIGNKSGKDLQRSLIYAQRIH